MIKTKRFLTVALAMVAMVATFIGTKPTYAGDGHIPVPKAIRTTLSNNRIVR